MKLGFVGTGTMTSAIVRGLRSAVADQHVIRLSPRNAGIAADLAARFPNVSIASSNQSVVDDSETVVLAIRPQTARSVISELRFRPDHHVISIVSALSLKQISALVAPATAVVRAVPLPSAADRQSPTAIFPPDRSVAILFAKLGIVFEVETEREFDAMCSATATIASYFAFADRIASWLTGHGVSQTQAHNYMAQIFWGLASTAVGAPERSFRSLAGDHATSGGINQQVLTYLQDRGVFENISNGLDGVMERIMTTQKSPHSR
jgi:pyrroline-5-carboxylate reductase